MIPCEASLNRHMAVTVIEYIATSLSCFYPLKKSQHLIGLNQLLQSWLLLTVDLWVRRRCGLTG